MKNAFRYKEQFKKAFSEDTTQREIAGFLGKPDGTVMFDLTSNVYVTLSNGQTLSPVRNVREPNVAGLPVIVGYEASNPKLLQILRARDVYTTPPYPDIPNHAQRLHQWPNVDTLWVRAQQFLPGLGVPTSGMLIQIVGFAYYSTGWQLLNNQIIDMTSYIPGSGANYVLVQGNASGAITYVVGSTVASRDLLTYTNIPAPTSGYLPLFAVKVYLGQTLLLNTDPDTDIIDLRFSGFASHAGGLIWGDITGTLSNQTDLQAALDAKISPTDLNYLITEDLSSQITGATAHFTLLVTALAQVLVYGNMRQLPSNITMDNNMLGFTLAYTPTTSDSLIVDYYPASPSAVFIYDDSNNLVIDDSGNFLVEA